MKVNNPTNLPQVFINAIINSAKNYDKVSPEKISTTQLIDAPIQRIMNREHDNEIVVDALDELYSLHGTAMHYIMEQAGTGYVTELRQETEVDGKIISGKIDLLSPMEKELWDWKETTVFAMKYNPDGKRSWHEQMNVNRFIFGRNGFVITKMKILIFFSDWREVDFKKESDWYPKSKAIVIDIPIWSDREVMEFIRERIRLHVKADEDFNNTGTCEPCSEAERWKDRDTFAVTKPDAARSLRTVDSLEEATRILSQQKSGSGYFIQTRTGQDNRCTKRTYCRIRQWCPYYKQKYFKNLEEE